MNKKYLWLFLISIPLLISSINVNALNITSPTVVQNFNAEPIQQAVFEEDRNLNNDDNNFKKLNTQEKDRYLSSDQIDQKLNELYDVKDSYNKGPSKYSRSIDNGLNYLKTQNTSDKNVDLLETNNFIIKFLSMESQMVFVNNAPSGNIIFQSSLLPYVVVASTPEIRNLINNHNGIVNLYADQVVELPEYEMSKLNKDKFDQISYFNSEAKIGATNLHELGITGKNVKVAVLDTGMDANHIDLQYTSSGSAKIIAEESFVDYNFDGVPDEGPEDLIGHGTHVAGTVAGNGYHIGVAPDANLLNAKVCGFGGCATSWMLEAIEWAYLQDADIITMSIGGSTVFGLDPLDELIDMVWQKGVVFTIAAGNDGPSTSTVQSPGIAPRVLTIGATDIYDKITGFSGRGPSVYGHYDPDISAPGENIFSTIPGDTYSLYTGTSMATPHVAGAVALLKEVHPYANPDRIKANLLRNAKDIGHPSNEQGAGLVDLVSTLENWNFDSGTVFPTFNENDVLYLSAGEVYSGYLEFVSGIRPRPKPHFIIPDEHNDIFEIDIDQNELFSRQQFYPYSIFTPVGSIEGDELSVEFSVWWLSFPANDRRSAGLNLEAIKNTFKSSNFDENLFKYFGRFITKIDLEIQIKVISPENDASTGTDAGDTIPGSMLIEIGNYSSYAQDIDFYEIYLTEGENYTLILDGMTGLSDFDLFIYNKSGYLTCQTCEIFLGGNNPERITLQADYSGEYYIRIDPWSVLYIDPILRFDSSGPYTLSIFTGPIDTPGGPGEPPPTSGTLLEFVESSIYGIDLDNDSQFDKLAIDITVDVIQTGLLDTYVWLALEKGIPYPRTVYTMAYLENYEFDDAGIQTLSLFIDGTIIADQNFFGSHVIYELFFGDPSSDTVLDDLFNIYSSPSLNSSDFGPVHLKYNFLNVSTVDEDNDGIAEWLDIDVSVNVLETYNYPSTYLTGVLHHPNDYFFWSINNPELIISQSGSYDLQFRFNPLDLISSVPELLDLEFTVIYSFDHPLAVYPLHYSPFPYALMVNEVFSIDTSVFFGSTYGDQIVEIYDYGLDSDFDGFYDLLVFEISFHIENSGYYSLEMHPWIWSIADQELTFHFDNVPIIEWYDAGDYVIEITTSGELFNSDQINGPFLILFFWLESFELDPYYGSFFWAGTADQYQNYVTNEYIFNDFDKAGLRFTGMINTNYLDLNQDGEDETFELILEFEVGYTGTFDIIMELNDYPFFSYYSDFQYINVKFDEVGYQNVSFYLDGRYIYQEELLGFVDIWTLEVISIGDFDNSSISTIPITYFDYQNGIFWVDFTLLPGARPAAAIYSVTDYGEDVDGNGLFENLVIELTLDVFRLDDFVALMDVFADPTTGYWNYIGFYYEFVTFPSMGLNTIQLKIPARDIVIGANDFYTNFELWMTLLDGFGSFLDSKGPVYTNYYSLDQFEYTMPAYEWFLNFDEIDSDNDTLMEAFYLLSDFHAIDLYDVWIDIVVDIYYVDLSGPIFISSLWDSHFVYTPDSWYFSFFEYLATSTGDYNIVVNLFIDGTFIELQEFVWLGVDTLNLPDYTLTTNFTSENWDLNPENDTIEFSYDLAIFENPGLFNMNFEIFMDVYIFDEFLGTWEFFDTKTNFIYSYFIGNRIFSGYSFWNAPKPGTFRFDFSISLYGVEIDFFSETTDLTEFTNLFDFGYTWNYNYPDLDGDYNPDTIQFSYGVYIEPLINTFDNLTFVLDIYSFDPDNKTTGYLDTINIDYAGPIMYEYWGDFLWNVPLDGYYYYEVSVILDTWKIGYVGLSTPFLNAIATIDYTLEFNYFAYDTNNDTLDDTIDIFFDFNFTETANYEIEVYVDIIYLNNSIPGNDSWEYIETLYNSFTVTNGSPEFYTSGFTWQAIKEGDYVFFIYIAYNGNFRDNFNFYWFGASPITTTLSIEQLT